MAGVTETTSEAVTGFQSEDSSNDSYSTTTSDPSGFLFTETSLDALYSINVTEFPSEDSTNDSYSTLTVNLSSSTAPEALDISDFPLNLPYTICEVVVAVAAVVGNALVLAAFVKDSKLWRRTNYYIVSLAVADFLFGLIGIPLAILGSVGLPRGFYPCLFSICFLLSLFVASIFCLLAVSIDRYWAILHPVAYTRDVGKKTAFVIICTCWVAAIIVGFIPMMGWNVGCETHCYFTKVVDYDYLVFLYFAIIITPVLLMVFFYADIYRVVLQQLRKRITMYPGPNGSGGNGGQVSIRTLFGAAQQCEINVAQNLAIIVFFFILCWIPLFTLNCIQRFCPDCQFSGPMVLLFIILSHLNSAVNPLIYACRMRDFRAALRAIFRGKKRCPTHFLNDDAQSFTPDNFRRVVILNVAERQLTPTRSSPINSETLSTFGVAVPPRMKNSPSPRRVSTPPLKVIPENS